MPPIRNYYAKSNRNASLVTVEVHVRSDRAGDCMKPMPTLWSEGKELDAIIPNGCAMTACGQAAVGTAPSRRHPSWKLLRGFCTHIREDTRQSSLFGFRIPTGGSAWMKQSLDTLCQLTRETGTRQMPRRDGGETLHSRQYASPNPVC